MKIKFSTLLLSLGIISLISHQTTAQDQAGDLEKARQLLRTGQYQEARKLFKPLLNTTQETDRRYAMGYFETFLAVGEYSGGLQEVETLLQDTPNDPYLLNMKGRFLVETGRYEEAEQAYNLSRSQKYDYWKNSVDLAELLEKMGRKREALSHYDQIVNYYDRGDFRDAETIGFAAYALSKIELFHDANRAFRTANQFEQNTVQNLYRWAHLFLEKFNNADALSTFEEALEINPHRADLYTGYARSIESFGSMESLAETALEKNPNHVEALNILAELNIIDNRYNEAESYLNKALEINPSYMLSLANLASVYHLREETEKFVEIEQRASAVKRNCGDFYITLSENCTMRFRYKDALSFSEKARRYERDNYRAYSIHGTNLLRLGRVAEARRSLDNAFNRDPFDLFAKNALDLIDEFDDFDVLENDHFVLRIHKSESSVIGPAILKIAEEAYDSLSLRYPYEPDEKILLEAYNNDADFDVRLAGIPNLDLLGVCFGDIVAFQTPKAREEGPYNWARTLWHELAHTMSLGISEHRVPRWFTEGLSVYEEKQARPEWHRKMEIELFTALEQDMLLPLEEIDRGFTRPKFAGQILLSYYQSYKLIEYIADTYGFPVITRLLAEFGNRKELDASFQAVLKKSPGEVNKEFFSYLQSQKGSVEDVISGSGSLFGTADKNESIMDKLFGGSTSPFFKNLIEGNELVRAGSDDEAEGKFMKALEIYPDYTQPGNPYLGLAEIYKNRGDIQKLVAILEEYLARYEYGAEEARLLGRYFAESGDHEKSEYFYLRSFHVEPYMIAAHSEFADFLMTDKDYDAEVEQRRIIVALNPLDLPKAYYNLALSQYNNNRIPEAKREVLRALEIAPGYREAQKLLLKCVGGSGLKH